MGHKNKKSLTLQVTEVLQSKLRIGESKHAHKLAGSAKEHIFSWNTYKAYQRHCIYFIRYCREKYGCKTLAQCRQYADEWLRLRIDEEKKSAYTIHLERAALCKLYGDTAADYISVPPRLRKNIVRSRRQAVRDAHFSEANHADFVEFCRSTGLRRAELRALTGDKLVKGDDGRWCYGPPADSIISKGKKGICETHSWFAKHGGMLWTTLADISPSAAHDELCTNLPSGIFLSAVVYPPFKLVLFRLRVSSPQLAAASAVGPVMRGPCFSLSVVSYSRYNNDRERRITVLLTGALCPSHI